MSESLPAPDSVPEELEFKRLSGHLDQLAGVARPLLRVPRWWMVVTAIAALASIVRIDHDGAGTSFRIEVTVVTAVIIGLTWLPTVIRMMVLMGGTVRAAGTEVSGDGLLPVYERRLAEASARLSAVEETTSDENQRRELRVVRTALESGTPSASRSADGAQRRLDELEIEYARLRRALPSGSERTLRMEEVTAEVRILAGGTRLPASAIRERFRKGSEAARVVALSLLEARPDSGTLDLVLEALADAHTPFEQFQALRVLDRLVPDLTQEERKMVLDAIDAVRRCPGDFDPDGSIVITTDDRSRWMASERLRRVLAPTQ